MPWCLFKMDSRTVGIGFGGFFVCFFFHFPVYLQLCMAGSPWAGGTACRSDTNLSIQARKQQGNGYPLLLWVYWRPQACEHRSHILLQPDSVADLQRSRGKTQIWDALMYRRHTYLQRFLLKEQVYLGISDDWSDCWLWLRNSYLTGKSPGLLFETEGHTSSNENKQKLIKAERKTKL